ncbi:MAG: hypothetical protein AVDCRST_MAG41-489, partial [uncultured Corynebacteriales bacterium]
ARAPLEPIGGPPAGSLDGPHVGLSGAARARPLDRRPSAGRGDDSLRRGRAAGQPGRPRPHHLPRRAAPPGRPAGLAGRADRRRADPRRRLGGAGHRLLPGARPGAHHRRRAGRHHPRADRAQRARGGPAGPGRAVRVRAAGPDHRPVPGRGPEHRPGLGAERRRERRAVRRPGPGDDPAAGQRRRPGPHRRADRQHDRGEHRHPHRRRGPAQPAAQPAERAAAARPAQRRLAERLPELRAAQRRLRAGHREARPAGRGARPRRPGREAGHLVHPRHPDRLLRDGRPRRLRPVHRRDWRRDGDDHRAAADRRAARGRQPGAAGRLPGAGHPHAERRGRALVRAVPPGRLRLRPDAAAAVPDRGDGQAGRAGQGPAELPGPGLGDEEARVHRHPALGAAGPGLARRQDERHRQDPQHRVRAAGDQHRPAGLRQDPAAGPRRDRAAGGRAEPVRLGRPHRRPHCRPHDAQADAEPAQAVLDQDDRELRARGRRLRLRHRL